MIHTRFRCRKLAKEHNHFSCREPSAETHLIHCRAPVMEHVHLNCRELVIHPFVLTLASSAKHTHLDYREQVVGIFTLTVVSWWLGISALTVELGWSIHICIRMLFLRAQRLGLKAWDQGQNRLVELHDLKTCDDSDDVRVTKA